MQRKLTRILQKNSFWLSILWHVIILLLFSLLLIPHKSTTPPKVEPYIPSYTYHEEARPSIQQSYAQSQNSKQVSTSKAGIKHAAMTAANQSSQLIKAKVVHRSAKNTETVHLIGDKKLDQPLLKLIGVALTEHLSYPKIAVDFNLRGTPVIGFTLHPDGQVSEVHLIKSSQTTVLDQAALDAAKTMGPLKNVDKYLSQPKILVIGIIFG